MGVTAMCNASDYKPPHRPPQLQQVDMPDMVCYKCLSGRMLGDRTLFRHFMRECVGAPGQALSGRRALGVFMIP
jgi:hypothetical protein